MTIYHNTSNANNYYLFIENIKQERKKKMAINKSVYLIENETSQPTGHQ